MTGAIILPQPKLKPSWLIHYHFRYKRKERVAQVSKDRLTAIFEVTDDDRLKWPELADVEKVYIRYDEAALLPPEEVKF